MPEYLKALHQRFASDPPTAETKRELDRILAKLRGRLNRSQRILLLHLLDLEDDLRDEESLHSFISGIRLICGLWRELSEEPPYSFDDENEKQARQYQGGEPPCRKSC